MGASSPNLQQSPTPGDGIASPNSDIGNRRLSGSVMVSIDENASDAGGTESGTTPTKKKSKIFSTKFVKKIFRSNSMTSANGADDTASVGQPDDALVLELADGVDDSRQSEYSVGTANDADGGTEGGTTPKKKKSKVFSTKFVKKMFRSNSMTSTGAPETPGSADGKAVDTPGDDGGSSVGGSSMKQKRKSLFSFGGRSSFSGGEGKASAPPSVASPTIAEHKKAAADAVYAGPVSPSFTAPRTEDLVYEDDDGEEEEQVMRVDTNFKMKQSFFDSPAPAPASTAAGARSAAPTTSPGSAKLLFGSIDDEPPLKISSPLPRLDYDLPMHSPTDAGTGHTGQESEPDDELRIDDGLPASEPAGPTVGSAAKGSSVSKPAQASPKVSCHD